MVPGNRPDGSVAGAGGIRRDLVPRAILSRCAWQLVTNVSDAVGSRVADSGSPGRPRTTRRGSPHVTDVDVRRRLRCRPQAGHEPGLCGRRYTPAGRCRRHGRARARGDRQLRRRHRRHGARAPSERRPHRCRPDRRTRLRARRGRSTPDHARAGRSGPPRHRHHGRRVPRRRRAHRRRPHRRFPRLHAARRRAHPPHPRSHVGAEPRRRGTHHRAGGGDAPAPVVAHAHPAGRQRGRARPVRPHRGRRRPIPRSAPTGSPPSSTTRWSARCSARRTTATPPWRGSSGSRTQVAVRTTSPASSPTSWTRPPRTGERSSSAPSPRIASPRSRWSPHNRRCATASGRPASPRG